MTYRIYDGYQMTYQDKPSDEFPCMRSTDLFDLEGTAIYESDILERGGTLGVVEWDEWARRFMLRVGHTTRHLDDACDWVVVGNAFEDGRLL